MQVNAIALWKSSGQKHILAATIEAQIWAQKNWPALNGPWFEKHVFSENGFLKEVNY